MDERSLPIPGRSGRTGWRDSWVPAAGGIASAATTTSKGALLAIWNPMAPRYGQQTYSVTGF